MSSSPEVEVTAILCDAAQAVGEKLYILGGGWSYLWTSEEPAVGNASLGIILSIPWTLTNRRLPVVTNLVSEDGEEIESDGRPIRVEGMVEAGRAVGVREGAPIVVVFAVNFNGLRLGYGGYVFQIAVEDTVRARVPFQVARPMGV